MIRATISGAEIVPGRQADISNGRRSETTQQGNSGLGVAPSGRGNRPSRLPLESLR
jgi:hypothetical protein